MSGRTADAMGASAAPMAGRSRGREALIAWSFAVPFVVLFLVFMAGPILVAFVVSFTDMQSTDLRHPLSVNFVGLNDYLKVLGDPKFQHAAANTAVFVVFGIPLTMALGLLAAVGLNQAIVKFRTVFRVGYYLPVVTSIVAIAIIWRLLLAKDSGLVNSLLGTAGIGGPGWLTDRHLALWSLIVMTAWRNLGFQMVIFLAGLQAISPELYEAAEVDGASSWQRFRRITLPLLRPTLLFSAVITSIGYLQFFEEPFVMTKGGPLDATLSLAFYAYNQFSFGNYGLTAAIAYILFVAIALLTLFQFRLFRSES